MSDHFFEEDNVMRKEKVKPTGKKEKSP